ncbi:cbb3-type cytochrome c oxidase subunit II [Luteolibacter pohnpeiensis]|uniref:Cbb3-type cytochrome c oxidase subunit II n=1 Tax=Luteolibacter pohnpeiensis TaxID=454153 RepID=A0A934SBV7_9BACT|nr:cbb3-type cytochrome c oxidase subunit II [Luteolibacter pohnpeiensis]MBK1883059.1 cbb3-type cytochrome c oxidase subunit II [Luteolibacter pohnpeiensis]
MRGLAWRASCLVAAVYGYFLIFAQFAWVELIRSAGGQEKPMLGAMAVAGMAAGFWIAWKGVTAGKIRIGLALAALASALAPLADGMMSMLTVSILTGIGVGMSTVGLATLLPSWCGLFWVGLGTGVGYACCNLPIVFQQSSAHQAWIGSVFAVVGLLVFPGNQNTHHEEPPRREIPFVSVLVLFTALVWLDSAAFFIIQHAVDLKSGTWGSGLLWRNAALHLAAAIASGVWLKSCRRTFVPASAWGLLAVAALAVNHETSRSVAGWLYPVGVSLYSVALVAWPGWFSGARAQHSIGWRAAWLFAIAGWFGSANGIGMAETLQRVPVTFILISGVCVLGVLVSSNRLSWRVLTAAAIVWVVAFLGEKKADVPETDSVALGKQVYLAEGCIHCHSQYVRPGSLDELNWGPVRTDSLKGKPVVIGNRRQGPDLTDVGARRSATWLKLHFINPQAFSPGSPMPSYAYLFKDRRGDDLVHYLQANGLDGMTDVFQKAMTWQPESSQSAGRGAELFQNHCAVCHGASGKGDGEMSGLLTKAPANLVDGPFVWSSAGTGRIRQIIKFGIPGTDMPGHETLKDEQIVALEEFVSCLRKLASETGRE